MITAMALEDSLRKREEFAVSLRKGKKDKIIRDRRKRLMLSVDNPTAATADASSNAAFPIDQ